MDPIGLTTPPAMVQKVKAAAEAIAEARAVDGEIIMNVGRTSDLIRKRGELLLKAKHAVPHGEWLETLAKHWPGLPERTARRYISQAKSANVADLIRGITHPETEPQASTRVGGYDTAGAGGRAADDIGDAEGESGEPAAANGVEDRENTEADADIPHIVADEATRSSPPAAAPSPPVGDKRGESGSKAPRPTGKAGGKPAGPTRQPELDFDSQATARRQAEALFRRKTKEAADTVEQLIEMVNEIVRIDPSGGLLLLADRSGLPFRVEEVVLKPDPARPMELNTRKRKVWLPLENVQKVLSQLAEGKYEQ